MRCFYVRETIALKFGNLCSNVGKGPEIIRAEQSNDVHCDQNKNIHILYACIHVS